MPKPPNSKAKKIKNSDNLQKIQNTNNIFKKFLDFLSQKILSFVIKNKSQIIPKEEEILVDNMLKFGEKTVEDAMISRSSIIALPVSANINEISDIINKFSHTRILIYQENLDNIIGFIHIKDVFKLVTKKQTLSLNKIIRKPLIAAFPMKLPDLFKEMQQKRIPIAIVVDEYGATCGMITTTDVLEAIFGDIDDEHDTPDSKNYKIIDSHTLLTNAVTEVEELENILNVKLKNASDEFETIGGLVLAKVGSVLGKGVKINLTDEVELEVIDSTPRALKKLKLKLKNKTIK